MQGIASLNDPNKPYSPQDFNRVANMVGNTYDSLDQQKKEALTKLSEKVASLPTEKIIAFYELLTFLKQHADNYADVVEELVARKIVKQGELPSEYDAPLFATLTAMLHTVIQKMRSGEPRGFAKGGEVSLHEAAEKVRKAGRNKDTILAHINPEEAALLKSQGGSGTINPETGLPEYGFFSDIFDGIGDFLGSAAPIIGSVLGSFVGMPFLGAVIGGGIGGLASGGGLKGALLGAAMGGVGSLAFGGISSMINGGGFMEGVTNTLPSYLGGSGENLGEALLSNTSLGGNANLPTGADVPLPPTGRPDVSNYVLSADGQSFVPPGDPSAAAAGSNVQPTVPGTSPASTTGASGAASSTAAKSASFMDDPMAWIKANPGKAALYGGGALLAANMLGGSQDAKAPPSLIANNPGLTKAEREAKYPWTVIDASKFTSTPAASPTTAPQQQYAWQQGVYSTPKFIAAAQGGIMDVRTGGHLRGPGTGTSDSIPAKLSDGEFVMTAKAVRGAGGGDRMKGAKKMYELMHKFERTA